MHPPCEITIYVVRVREITASPALTEDAASTARFGFGKPVGINPLIRCFGNSCDGEGSAEEISNDICSIKVVMALVNIAVKVNGKPIRSHTLAARSLGYFFLSVRQKLCALPPRPVIALKRERNHVVSQMAAEVVNIGLCHVTLRGAAVVSPQEMQIQARLKTKAVFKRVKAAAQIPKLNIPVLDDDAD